MTILNVFVYGEGAHALIGVDTTGTSTEMRVATSKMMPLVHIPAVIAMRGTVGFLQLVTLTAATSSVDFDGMLEQMPTILAGSFQGLVEFQKRGGIDKASPIESQMIAAVGWSEREQKILLREWTQETAGKGFIAGDVLPYLVAPWDQEIDHLTRVTTHQDMARLARAQLQLMKDRARHLATGGKLIVARISRGNLGIQHVCDLDIAPQVRLLDVQLSCVSSVAL